ncbi:glycosyltransferase [Ktedonospora formicarum]|uniref:Trehalose synthase n=1 Tax=Ktedonospora formicarum TaxID=2778364 RepID=A0A8J3HT02_9CHLR|nr:glycosyltransferase [Ktedonospora formicarum]GHO42711.1 trehalose synthase [Ktedonospora formicarum]
MQISPILERFRQYSGDAQIMRIYEKAASLQGLRVLHINTTARGGGVAEILSALTPITNTLGITHARKVIQLDEASGALMGHLVDLLQNHDEPGAMPERDVQIFLEKLSHSLIRTPELDADIYVIHDFQLVPLAQLFSWLQPAFWFCHVDTAHPNPHGVQYVRQFLDDYELAVFNTSASVLQDLPLEKRQVINLGIDPFVDKNQAMDRTEGIERIRRCGLDPERPLLTQVARFGRWKDPWQAVDIYRLVKVQEPHVQLALVGAMEASDDHTAMEVLQSVKRYVGEDPDVHFLYDPQRIGNREVNAFQRFSNVVLQRSQREGFGLTATEAMWKYQPIIGTSSTGLRSQIIHEENGYIADDVGASAFYALHLLHHPEIKDQLGDRAHAYVQQHHLLPGMLEDYLDSLLHICQRCEVRRHGIQANPESMESATKHESSQRERIADGATD